MSSVSDRGGFEEFEVLLDDHGTTRTVSPCGEIDMATAPLLGEPLTAALSNGFDKVVLDLRRTTFIDSTGISVALHAWELARLRGTRFVVIPGPRTVHNAFVVTGLVDYLPFADDGDGP